MNKAPKLILNILLVIASLGFLISLIFLITSFTASDRKAENPAETYSGVFEYELKHRAYGEILGHYYAHRLSSFEAPAGYEDLYRVAEYAHTAFMIRVYDEKGDARKASLYREKAAGLRQGLGDYEYTADEVEALRDGAFDPSGK
ncbi:MAG: hypothetical protein K6G45_00835 [Lachnospiraceae bacterium]|nr:hypothetical protein [Lachnospiraceae bacterium]